MTEKLYAPSRGDVWDADFNHELIGADGQRVLDRNGNPQFSRFREQGDKRPCVILSVDAFNRGDSGLVIVVPITSRIRDLPTHVPLVPPEGGLRKEGVIICEGIRSIARQFLMRKRGQIESKTMRTVMERLNDLILFS
jgi:mRNA interferase MazF